METDLDFNELNRKQSETTSGKTDQISNKLGEMYRSVDDGKAELLLQAPRRCRHEAELQIGKHCSRKKLPRGITNA